MDKQNGRDGKCTAKVLNTYRRTLLTWLQASIYYGFAPTFSKVSINRLIVRGR